MTMHENVYFIGTQKGLSGVRVPIGSRGSDPPYPWSHT